MENQTESVAANIQRFIDRQKELLDFELRSETDSKQVTNNAEDQKTQDGLELEIADISVGLYGRTVVSLQCTEETEQIISEEGTRIYGTKLLPSHRFTVGDEVALLPKKKGQSLAGVIYKITEEIISVALFESKSKPRRESSKTITDDDEETQSSVLHSSPTFTLVRRSNVDVHRKMLSSLTELSNHGVDHPIASNILREIFSSELTKELNEEPEIKPISQHINKSQIEAISYALSTPLSLIHGPPGTGKTTTLVELIHQALILNPNQKILVTAPSNIAVDTILQKCSTNLPKRYQLLRIGHPARIHNHTLPHSLEHKIHTSNDSQILNDVHQELNAQLQSLNNHYDSYSSFSSKTKKNRLTLSQRRNCKKEISLLRKEIKQRHQKMVYSLLSSSHIIFATNVGCATLSKKLSFQSSAQNKSSNSHIPNQNYFDLLIMDEAAQSLPPAALLPILLSKRCVLAGDDRQLPPTIKSQLAKNKKLDQTFFDMIQNPWKRKLLDTQYRMHEIISSWASVNMYDGRLKSAEHVRSHVLSDLDEVEHKSGITDVPMMMIDTAGCDLIEERHETSGSRLNRGEGEIAKKIIENLLKTGLLEQNIAVISPYNAQVELLKNLLVHIYPKLEVKSVDGFQGGERDAVVLSLVRSNDDWGKNDSGVGFLKDRRRINVAVTRAKRHVAVICDSETVSRDDFLKSLVEWIEEKGEVRSALEYLGKSQDHSADIESVDLAIVEQMFDDTLNVITKKSNRSIAVSHAQHSSKILNPKGVPEMIDNRNRSKVSKAKEDMRLKLKNRIEIFRQTGKEGDELEFESTLSKVERLFVHEIAEELGFEHKSEGKEGSDRRIIVKLKKMRNLNEDKLQRVEKDDTKEEDVNSVIVKPMNQIADNTGEVETDNQDQIQMSNNDLLKSLAKERMQRNRQSENAVRSVRKDANKKKKQKKKKKVKSKNEIEAGKKDAEIDEMAFLDEQIQKVQTSHGRKVEGTGSKYRTIINGILTEKPKPKEQKKDARASVALKMKLKKAEQERKSKKKKK